MKRRDAIKTLGIGALAATAGCLGGFERQSAWRAPPLVEDRPAAVYLPAITEGMKLYGKTTAGPYGVALTYSYPHRFWTAAGSELQRTVVEADDSIHLMASLWDAETGTVLPLDAGVSIEILRDGDLVSEEVAYPMLSQQMGMHYGSNYVLDGEGDYEARVHVGGTSLSRTGSFAGGFGAAETATFEFAFETDDLYDVELTRLGDEAGSRGAVPAMEMMGVPTGKAPAVDALPGRHLGRRTSADALFDAFVVDDGSRFGVNGAYLYVHRLRNRLDRALYRLGRANGGHAHCAVSLVHDRKHEHETGLDKGRRELPIVRRQSLADVEIERPVGAGVYGVRSDCVSLL